MAEGRISRAFAKARAENRAAFIPYITAGDPTLEWTGRYLDRLAAAGADIIELGVPFSDPIADGPVNQRSSERALKSKTSLSKIIDLAARKRDAGFETALLAFSYYNPILRMGLNRFAGAAQRAGLDGVLVVDLPPEEAGEYRAALQAASLDAVFLASPTTTDERLRTVSEASSGFVYYVSRMGVTGARDSLENSLEDGLIRARKNISKPLAVGFGISTPEQAAAAAKLADGVIVGSALVKILEGDDPESAGALLQKKAAALSAALKRRTASC